VTLGTHRKEKGEATHRAFQPLLPPDRFHHPEQPLAQLLLHLARRLALERTHESASRGNVSRRGDGEVKALDEGGQERDDSTAGPGGEVDQATWERRRGRDLFSGSGLGDCTAKVASVQQAARTKPLGCALQGAIWNEHPAEALTLASEQERLTEAFIAAALFFLLLRTNNDQSILHFAQQKVRVEEAHRAVPFRQLREGACIAGNSLSSSSSGTCPHSELREH
jgi:hypothetical protein